MNKSLKAKNLPLFSIIDLDQLRRENHLEGTEVTDFFTARDGKVYLLMEQPSQEVRYISMRVNSRMVSSCFSGISLSSNLFDLLPSYHRTGCSSIPQSFRDIHRATPYASLLRCWERSGRERSPLSS